MVIAPLTPLRTMIAPLADSFFEPLGALGLMAGLGTLSPFADCLLTLDTPIQLFMEGEEDGYSEETD